MEKELVLKTMREAGKPISRNFFNKACHFVRFFPLEEHGC